MKFSDLPLTRVGHEILLAGGVWLDSNGMAYICVFPEFGDDALWMLHHKLERIPMDYEDWKKLLRQSDLVETEVLAKAKDGKLYKAVARKCERNISQGVSWRVFKRDGYRCRYCGNDDVPLTVDHVVLWEEGGPSIEENLVSACRKCNKQRGSTPYREWISGPYYLARSENLPEEAKEANRALVATLDTIPRMVHKRSHR
jgi:hypothetical protein